MIRIGIDTGGTFTDLLATADDGRQWIVKVPSTPKEPSASLVNGVMTLVQQHQVAPADIEVVLHGTTVGINALLQGRYPPVGLVVTTGFRYLLELAKQTVKGERGAVYTWVKPTPIVPLERIREVGGRLDSRGGEVRPLDVADVEAAAEGFRQQGIAHVAVCLINAYASPVHEIAVREIFARVYPECSVDISSEILPEFREYERALATIMNALLKPVVADYIRRVEAGLRERGIGAPLFIMKSSGGVTTAARAQLQPVQSALSGPAAAVLGLADVGLKAGRADLITFDMGGTSTDVGIVDGGVPAIRHEATIGEFPLRTTTIDVVSVGAGGGSIAWVAPGGFARVGPQSTGADPGPACYDKGGTEAAISDANVYLGRLGTRLAGGSFLIRPELATAAIERYAEKLGMSPLEAASGILEVANNNMADAIRQISVRRGRDPRRFTLVAAGGAGPLHATRLAAILSIPEVLVPPAPGVGCATGLLASDVQEDLVTTEIRQERDIDPATIASRYANTEERVVSQLQAQGFAPDAIRLERSADLRYKGQRTELSVPVPPGPIDQDTVDAMVHNFHQAYHAAFDYDYEGEQPTELVNLRVRGIVSLARQGSAAPQAAGSTATAVPREHRQAYFEGAGWVETAIYHREDLPVGSTFSGPAIVEQYDATTVMYPGQVARVDASGSLLITIPSA